MQKFIIGTLATVVVLGSCLTASADARLKQLFRYEHSTLDQIPGQYLRNLLTAPAPKSANVRMTRAWIDSQPVATGNEQFECLAEALYFEARGESVKGQFAVAEVIINRANSTKFPGTICKVVNQGTGRKHRCQFSYTCDGHPEVIGEQQAYDRVAKVARMALDGKVPALTDGATFYHTTGVSPSWSRKFNRTTKIGVHLFYRPKVRTASN
jgi:spore germination cell wall hydrolase CwlJ-like protein